MAHTKLTIVSIKTPNNSLFSSAATGNNTLEMSRDGDVLLLRNKKGTLLTA